MIISNENLFLIFLGLIWIIGAVIQDLRKREVDNIWSFSLIAFALAYRSFASVYANDYWFILNGIIGFFIFLILGNLFYYSRLFAGGDAKLLIALGTILPLSYNWIINGEIFVFFILLFLVLGSVYSIIWALFLVGFNWKRFVKEFSLQVRNYKKLFLFSIIFFIFWSLFAVFVNQLILLVISLIIILFPCLFVFSKAVEECCMVKSLFPKDVTEGDWLYEDIIIHGKKIKAKWEGVTSSELKLIRNNYRKKVLVKQGIPFTPSFLFGFIALLFLSWRFGIV